ILPSFTTSSRSRSFCSITAVSGSTPSVFTSPSCSTQPRMLLSSGSSLSSSSSLIAIRASFAIWRTCSGETDMEGADSRRPEGRQASGQRLDRPQREAGDLIPEVALERPLLLAVVDGAPDDDPVDPV